MVDANNGLAGDGRFHQWLGGLPVGSLISECFSGKYTQKQMMRRVNGKVKEVCWHMWGERHLPLKAGRVRR